MNIKLFLCCLLVGSTLFSCQKNDITYDQNKKGSVKLKFDHIVSGKTLQLKTGEYSNSFNERYKIDILKYYISNIKLTNDQGKVFILPKKESFFLIDAEKPSSLFPMFEVPEGNYTQLQFILGIDEETSKSPAEDRTGVLDIATSGMYWGWNSGYIFFKMEGTSDAVPNDRKRFAYHIGLFGGYDKPTKNNIKTINLDLSKAGSAQVKAGFSSDIHLLVDIGQTLDGTNKMSIAKNPMVMVSGPNDLIADNYKDMFTHDHTHNQQKLPNE